MRQDLARPVDLAADRALMTRALFRIGEERHFWYQRVHHIAVDAYALSLMGSASPSCTGRWPPGSRSPRAGSPRSAS
ncbi:hypothetical protein SCALM49S_05625 [Streptomyces californicus]